MAWPSPSLSLWMTHLLAGQGLLLRHLVNSLPDVCFGYFLPFLCHPLPPAWHTLGASRLRRGDLIWHGPCLNNKCLPPVLSPLRPSSHPVKLNTMEMRAPLFGLFLNRASFQLTQNSGWVCMFVMKTVWVFGLINQSIVFIYNLYTSSWHVFLRQKPLTLFFFISILPPIVS